MGNITTTERVAHAMVSSNLKQKETRCDLDYVIAAGIAGRRHRDAMTILRFHLVGDVASARSVRHAIASITNRLNLKRRWNMQPKELARISELAMRLYLNPRCPKCEGRKFQLVENTPALSAKVCPKCRGTGNRSAPDRDGDRIRNVVEVLGSIVHLAGDSIRQVTGNRE